jgi:hypothetical protein
MVVINNEKRDNDQWSYNTHNLAIVKNVNCRLCDFVTRVLHIFWKIFNFIMNLKNFCKIQNFCIIFAFFDHFSAFS